MMAGMDKIDLIKAHVSAYTKKDGTFVSAHEKKAGGHALSASDIPGHGSFPEPQQRLVDKAKAAALAGDLAAAKECERRSRSSFSYATQLRAFCKEVVARMERKEGGHQVSPAAPDWAKKSVVPLPPNFDTLGEYEKQKIRDVVESIHWGDPTVIDGLAAKLERKLNLRTSYRFAVQTAAAMRGKPIKD